MLAELAAFNAGFAVIKQTVLNGKDITSALGSLQYTWGRGGPKSQRQLQKEEYMGEGRW